MEKILLDTDIGSDIDDAACLAYLLSQKQCDLVGITTVSGEAEKRAMIASAICRTAHREIPIYPGIENPLLLAPRQKVAAQAKKLGSWSHAEQFERGRAIDFMRETIRKNPGEITLLAIGPMTNVAALFQVDREIPSLLKRLVLMAGVFTPEGRAGTKAEWNVLCDPHAAAVVYQTPVSVHKSVGLDVTTRVYIEKEEFTKQCRAEILKPVLDFSQTWFEFCDRVTFHDPLAAVSVFDDSVCRFRRGTIEVNYMDRESLGETCWSEDPSNGGHLAALEVDADRFFQHYFSVVG